MRQNATVREDCQRIGDIRRARRRGKQQIENFLLIHIVLLCQLLQSGLMVGEPCPMAALSGGCGKIFPNFHGELDGALAEPGRLRRCLSEPKNFAALPIRSQSLASDFRLSVAAVLRFGIKTLVNLLQLVKVVTTIEHLQFVTAEIFHNLFHAGFIVAGGARNTSGDFLATKKGEGGVTMQAGHKALATLDDANRALAFFDLSRPCTIEAGRVDNLALTVSPDLLLPLVANPDGIHGLVLPPDNEANVALTLHLENLWHRLPELSPEAAEEETRSLAVMLAAVIGAQINRRSIARAHLRKIQFGAICRWIDENLANSSLAPSDITRKFYMTRPTLYRMFEQRGGIMKYILERRLEKLFHDLADRSRPAEKIGDVMHRWGLRDHTYAGRAFRSYFGVTPRQLRSSLPSQLKWSPLGGTETFRIRNIERLGPLLEKHNVRVRREDGKDASKPTDTKPAREEPDSMELL